MSVSAKVATRISVGLKKYRDILQDAKQRDDNEANTVKIITEMLDDVFGYDKFQHISAELGVRNHWADLAVIVDNEARFLIEVKAIGVDLNDTHVDQVVDYATNKGTDWVVLTNGVIWRAYKVEFTKPIDKALIFEFDVLATSPKDTDIVECFGSLCLECFSKDSMMELYEQKHITSKYALAALLLNDSILDELRHEIKKLSDVRVDTDSLRSLIANEVLRPELVNKDEAKAAAAYIKKLELRHVHEKRKRAKEDDSDEVSNQNVAQQPSPLSETPILAQASSTSNG